MVAIKIKVIAIYSDSRIENVCQYLVHVEPRPILQQFRFLMSGVKSVHVSDVACTVMVCNSNVFIYIFYFKIGDMGSIIMNYKFLYT